MLSSIRSKQAQIGIKLHKKGLKQNEQKIGPQLGISSISGHFWPKIGLGLGWGLKIFKNWGQGWGWGCKIKKDCG